MKFYKEPEIELLRLKSCAVCTASDPNNEDELWGEGDLTDQDGSDL